MRKRFLNIVVDIMRELTLKTGYPVPMNRGDIYSWAQDLDIETKGPIALYTGALYQIMPYIESLVAILEKVENNRALLEIMNIGKHLASSFLTKSLLRASHKRVKISRNILKAIALLLREADVNFSYLYKDDLYSGVLLYDLGLSESFLRQARKVYRTFKDRGIKKVITVDPHTTYVLKNVYPKFIDNFDIEVQSYLEVLSSRIKKKESKTKLEVVIHDPCFYARYQNMVEEPRNVLKASGIKVIEPKRSRKFTACCGGPIEALYPELSRKIAMDRVKELSSISNVIVTMCPICFSNLSKVKTKEVEIIDLALLVARVRGLMR